MSDTYRINGPRVIFENIDGELILVHMEKGTYYSTDEVGAELWGLIEAGCSVGQMCEALAARYGAERSEVAPAVAAFLDRLGAEDLVSVAEAPPGANVPAGTQAPAQHPFRPPVLNAYRDMQDMLALDPIHDVEAAGWPVPLLGEPAPEPEPAP